MAPQECVRDAQAGHCAQKTLKTTILGKELFKPCKADDCVFVSTDTSTGYAAMGTFVDDTFIVSEPGSGGKEKALSTLQSKFKITIKEEPTMFCGVQIIRNRKARWLKLH